jgi:hypothetical protein
MDDEARVCKRPGCETVLARREGETSQNFKNRVYCCKRCAATHGNYLRGRRRRFGAVGLRAEGG